MTRRFFTLAVFTETPLAGNPLAVVLDAEGLDDLRMQAIAAEFNLSETVFLLEQGFEMGRPSLMTLGFVVEGGALRSASIGGSAVIVSSGALDL
jgi:predicted PhzF superfamily epimerase YddE/YHI9